MIEQVSARGQVDVIRTKMLDQAVPANWTVVANQMEAPMDATAVEQVGAQRPVSVSLTAATTDLLTGQPFDGPEQNPLQILATY